MKKIYFPPKETWNSLTKRPEIDKTSLENTVGTIINSVKEKGDQALLEYSVKFDSVLVKSIKVTESEISEAESLVSEELKRAIDIASANIRKFHSAQLTPEPVVNICEGVTCWRRNLPIEKIGLYIPGGSAPLFSTVLMLAIPARVAGCKEIVLCTPPDYSGNVNPLILYCARSVGITEIFKVGGAQAIAAMAYGTETIPRVFKIFGPGNQFVTRAKEMVQRDGVPIDMPAGPSELLVVADGSANPEFIAADLLSQAEHGPDSQVILVTDNEKMIDNTCNEIVKQVQVMARKKIAHNALENSKFILFHSIEECIDYSNLYAPEHLILAVEDAEKFSQNVINAGSVFLGHLSCESAGDYATGTNHTLPTNGYARNYSGVSTESFIKRISFQEVTQSGILNIGPAIEQMAEAELLFGHKNAVTVRLNKLKNV
jgi:histidinol dehydrogenase